ncbi:MAG: alpha/beta hydrolase [Bdellovibrionaceae bacterium]|nr:alpha/beta hydrolase [Pseudobdellovibrionaceae bacterium]
MGVLLGRVCFCAFALGLSGCMTFFYYPTSKTYFDPAQAGLRPEDVTFTTGSGEKIHAWWFESAVRPSKGTIVFFHGNAENLTSHFASLMWLPKEGYSYLIFDYPGYGRSTGRTTAKGTVEAGHAALEWVHRNKDPRPLIIYGHSLGGNVALRTALELRGEIPYKAIVIDASFPSYQKIAANKLSQFWITWPLQPLAYLLVSDSYAPKGIQQLSPVPMLIIHGQSDLAVEPEYGERLYELAGDPKEIWRIPGGVHGSTFWSHDLVYRRKFLDYLTSLDRAVKP